MKIDAMLLKAIISIKTGGLGVKGELSFDEIKGKEKCFVLTWDLVKEMGPLFAIISKSKT